MNFFMNIYYLQNTMLRRGARSGLGISHRRLSGLREMAQRPQGPEAFLRRYPALPEDRRRPERDHPPHGRDR